MCSTNSLGPLFMNSPKVVTVFLEKGSIVQIRLNTREPSRKFMPNYTRTRLKCTIV